MSTQQQPRPWFRLATMIRPAAPAPAQQQPAPAPQPPPPAISPFRPPVALPRPLPPPSPPASAATTAPPSPVAPAAPFNLPIVSPSSVTPTTPRSPQITSTGAPAPAAVSTVASPTPKSPAAINANGVVVPPPPPAAATPALAPPAPPAAIPKPDSPIIKTTSSSPPPSPGQKASAETSSATRPVVSSSLLAPSPKTKLVSSSPSLQTLSTSPAPNAVRAHAASSVPPPPSPVPPPPSPVTTIRAHPASFSPISSPKTVKPSWEKTPPPPAESPVVKPNLSHPPSPLTLPPPQLSHDYLEPIPPEAEKKTVLTQDTNHEKPPKINLKKSSGGHLMQSKNKINSSDASPEFGMKVVTLAGENKGAVMELSPAASRKKYDYGKNFWSNGQKLGSDKEEARYHHQVNNDKHENDHHQYHDKGTSKMKPQPPMDAFVNSNVQGVNNSILYNCTYKNRDPGVHLSVSRKGNGVLHGIHLQ